MIPLRLSAIFCTDSSIHNNAPRAASAHTARPRWETKPPACSRATRRAIQADARWGKTWNNLDKANFRLFVTKQLLTRGYYLAGQRDRKFKKKFGSWKNDHWRLWYFAGCQPSLHTARYPKILCLPNRPHLDSQYIFFLHQPYAISGTLSQVVGKGRRATLQARQAFLFSNHLLLTTRATGGRLHLPPAGRLPLHDALLVEDPSNHDDDGGWEIENTAKDKLWN